MDKQDLEALTASQKEEFVDEMLKLTFVKGKRSYYGHTLAVPSDVGLSDGNEYGGITSGILFRLIVACSPKTIETIYRDIKAKRL